MVNGSGGISTSGMSAFLFPLFLMALENVESEFSSTGSAFSSLDDS